MTKFLLNRHDIKILWLRREMGLEGYAIYVMLVEALLDENGFKLSRKHLPDLAYDFGIDEKLISNVVDFYGLFELIDDAIFSGFALMP